MEVHCLWCTGGAGLHSGKVRSRGAGQSEVKVQAGPNTADLHTVLCAGEAVLQAQVSSVKHAQPAEGPQDSFQQQAAQGGSRDGPRSHRGRTRHDAPSAQQPHLAGSCRPLKLLLAGVEQHLAEADGP